MVLISITGGGVGCCQIRCQSALTAWWSGKTHVKPFNPPWCCNLLPGKKRHAKILKGLTIYCMSSFDHINPWQCLYLAGNILWQQLPRLGPLEHPHTPVEEG